MTQRLKDLASYLNAELIGDDCEIRGIAPVQSAQSGHITFIDNPNYRKFLNSTQASAVIITRDLVEHCPTNALVVPHTYLAYAKVAQLFSPVETHYNGVHPSADCDASLTFGDDVSIGQNVVIGKNVVLGRHVRIGAGCVIADDCFIGDETQLYPRVTLYRRTQIGKRTLLHSGVVIGADGFGMVKEHGAWVHIPQLGAVQIGDDVSIGANTTIDRGALDDTIIENGVKLDNQIQIGHNVKIGAHTAIAGCVGIAGSTQIGRDCVIGGGVGISGHLTLADNVSITGMSTVYRSINEPGVYSSGVPLQETRQLKRNGLRFAQLDSMAKRIRSLEQSVETLTLPKEDNA